MKIGISTRFAGEDALRFRAGLRDPRLWCCLLPLAIASFCLSGCNGAEAKKDEAKPPEVDIDQPYEQEVTEHQEFTGQTMAVETIEIRARVSGYLERNFFKDGDIVRAGELLFQIDERPYRAEFEHAMAALAQAKAHLERLKRQEERAQALLDKKSISQQDFEAAAFDRAEAEAAVAAAVATRQTAELNLDFTKITSRIDGRISRRMVDPGNLVQADVTPLTTVVSIDPIYAYFDIDERTLLRLRRMMEAEHADAALSAHVSVAIALADGEVVPQGGTIDFLDNQVESTTGTLRARVKIDNKNALLSPGLFVRLRVPVGIPRVELLVREEALQTSQGQRFVWVLDDQNKPVNRPVKIGWQVGDRRVIHDGLRLSDRVIVKGMQRVREGKEVRPREPGDKKSELAANGKKSESQSAPSPGSGAR
jgi:membrane fusion protein, multidrug efflux system